MGEDIAAGLIISLVAGLYFSQLKLHWDVAKLTQITERNAQDIEDNQKDIHDHYVNGVDHNPMEGCNLCDKGD